MAVRKIIRMGHPTLRRKAESVAENAIGSESLSNLIKDMQDTLCDYGGIGLAAPQITNQFNSRLSIYLEVKVATANWKPYL